MCFFTSIHASNIDSSLHDDTVYLTLHFDAGVVKLERLCGRCPLRIGFLPSFYLLFLYTSVLKHSLSFQHNTF